MEGIEQRGKGGKGELLGTKIQTIQIQTIQIQTIQIQNVQIQFFKGCYERGQDGGEKSGWRGKSTFVKISNFDFFISSYIKSPFHELMAIISVFECVFHYR